MDLTFRTDGGVFNIRACAVILRDGKILAMRDGRSPYYYLPGGRVRLHETAEAAVLREVHEELDARATIVRPLWLNQCFFTEDVTHERFHELCFYFLIRLDDGALPRGDRFTHREGVHTQAFEWLPFERLRTEYFYPLFLKERIFELPQTLELLTTFE